MKSFLLALVSCLAAAVVHAAPPSGGDYAKDVATTAVSDRTISAIRTLNLFLCVFAKALPSDMVNRGQYLALVRLAECGGAEAAGVQTLSVVSARDSDAQPQVSKGHFFLKLRDDAEPVTLYFHLVAAESRSARAPNGVFTLEMSGRLDGKPTLRGRIVATTSELSMVLNADLYGQQETFQLALKNTGNASGTRVEGMLRQAEGFNGQTRRTSTYRFAEGARYYCRQVVDVDASGLASPATTGCFDRATSEAIPLSVTYGLYDDKGLRVYPDASGMTLRDEFGRYGYASYRAVSPSTLPSGSSVTRADGTKAYTVFRAPGSLERITFAMEPISTLGQGFEADVALSDLNGAADPQQVYMYWDSSAQRFRLVDRLTCTGTSLTDCRSVPFPPGTMLSVPELLQRIGGTTSLFVFDRGETFEIDLASSSTPMVRRQLVQSISPAQEGLSELICLADCPDLDAMKVAADVGMVYGVAPVKYRWDSATLSLRDGAGRSMVADSPNLDGLGVAAITSGPMLSVSDFELATASCKPKTQADTCDAAEIVAHAPAHYRWSMPLDSAQRPAFLREGAVFVEIFPEPEKVRFKMPASAPSFANSDFEVQLDTAQGLAGLPVSCISGIEAVGLEALCMPRVVIPEGGDGYVTRKDGTRLWVRSLHRELLLRPVEPAVAAADAQLNLKDDLLPAVPPISVGGAVVDATDPADPASSKYAGAAPTESYFRATTPSVVDGKRITSTAPVAAK